MEITIIQKVFCPASKRSHGVGRIAPSSVFRLHFTTFFF